MAVPKYRTSKSKRNMRRSHHALKRTGSSRCPSCNEVKLPHIVCPSCGFYKGKVVMTPRSTAAIDQDFVTES